MEAAGASCRGAAEMAGRRGVERARRETARSDRDSIVDDGSEGSCDKSGIRELYF